MALAMNPLAVLAIPVLAALWLQEGAGRPAVTEPLARWLRDARVWAVAVLVFTVARNLPFPPFSSLAPGP